MTAPSSDSVEVLGGAADLDTATSRIFFGDDESSWPAAKEIKSTLKTSLRTVCDRYGVPAGYTPLCGDSLGWAASKTPPEGSICVYTAALDAGLRFPLHSFYAKLLRHYGLAPSQLAPNAWSYMAAFVLLCTDASVEPLVSVFCHFFSICPLQAPWPGDDHSGWYYFEPYGNGTRGRLFKLHTGGLATMFEWRTRFFFLKSSPVTPWRCPVKWGKARTADAFNHQLNKKAKERLLQAAGKKGININSLLSRHDLPVGSRTPLHATVKAEVASTRKRKSPAAAVTPPAPLGLALDQRSSAEVGGSEVAQLKAKLAKLEEEHAAEVAKLEEEHAAEVAKLEQEHAANIARVKDDAAKEVQDAKKDMVLAVFPNLDASLLGFPKLKG